MDCVEAVRNVLDAVARRDLARLLELTDPEIEWQSFFALHGREYHGHDGIRTLSAVMRVGASRGPLLGPP